MEEQLKFNLTSMDNHDYELLEICMDSLQNLPP